MKKLIVFFLALVMLLSLSACSDSETPNTTPSGGAHFTVVVTDLDGSESTFEYTSDAGSVGEALQAAGLLEGKEGEWGLYILSVNGITADSATEGTYWAFYINGEYAMTGVDRTPITDGATYTFVKTSIDG